MRDIKDKKLFLQSVHEKNAETYDSLMKNRELSNKIRRFRKVLLSFSGGDVLELGVGTGASLDCYDPNYVDSYVGIDWSPQMLIQAF